MSNNIFMEGPAGQVGGEGRLAGAGDAEIDVKHMGMLRAEEGAQEEGQIWTITKANRADEEATLHVTGRDVAQSDTVIRFDKSSWTWKPMGSADWLAEQRARLAYDGSPIVKTIKKLLDQSPGRRWDGTAKDLMEAGKYIVRTYLAVNTTKLGHEIKALEKPLFDFDGIVHTAVRTGGNGGRKHSFYYQDLGQFEELPEVEQEELPLEFREEDNDGQAEK